MTLDNENYTFAAGSTNGKTVYLKSVGMPENAGTLTYTLGSCDSTITANLDEATGALTVTVSGDNLRPLTIPVTISSTNYKDVTVNVTVNVTSYPVPTLTARDITVKFNEEELPASLIQGTAKVGEDTISGSWSWTSTAPKNVADSGKVNVTFTPENDTEYAPATTAITVTITKATLPQPTFTLISENDGTQWLSGAGHSLVGVAADFAWTDEDELIQQGKSYGWTVTADVPGNYDPATISGSVVLWPAPASSGGSGSGSGTSTTVKNEDGSTTTTKTDKATGTVTETTTTSTGTAATVVTTADGSVTTEVSVSTKDAQSGEVVTLPVEDVDKEDGKTISVSVPKNSTVTVEIPVENVTPGTVVVMVSADGTETVVSTTGLTEGGVTVTLTEDATLKVIENATEFEDVEAGSYYEDAADWASARGITSGTSETTFSPDATCTHSELVTLLYRAVGSPDANGEGSVDFSDAESETFYHDALAWAVENEIVTGYGDGTFGVRHTITREQVAVMLYRLKNGATSTESSVKASDFTDFGEVSDYATAAMEWAVREGILQGYNGNLMPKAECTRGQIVAMLYRLLGN